MILDNDASFFLPGEKEKRREFPSRCVGHPSSSAVLTEAFATTSCGKRRRCDADEASRSYLGLSVAKTCLVPFGLALLRSRASGFPIASLLYMLRIGTLTWSGKRI